ncbi:beta-N-acetylhexosaminidase [Ginsengibacter hankyongi]|uniref:beta-N-acetylhexosaminidase n=1 Tax=Ginsengibacter hankyongi TaxID=2607284 RepID=A0A5J5IDX1_9BACT|nr:beta-N-acetylhexosaminidase [Ginsengibacter hankyongi]KAA9037221.1 beta-N-acetylhexosaminidase [Ginsengibacter hankyongi]
MKKLIITSLILANLSVFAQTNVSIIPKPVEVTQKSGYFNLSKSTIIIANSSAKHNADMLNFYLKKLYGFTLPVKAIPPANGGKTFITLAVKKLAPGKKDQYTLSVYKNKVDINATSNQALFYGIQSLLQLLPADKDSIQNIPIGIPQVTIKDYPRFQYRGMHLDVGRHFFDVDEVKKYIDYLAFHKFNTFHWHLTEDQGWRIEIKKYPLLTSVGGFRNGTIIGHHPGTGNDSLHYGGFYTQKEVKDVVKYAQDRYITIIPEIEMPGHSSAAIAAYPKLSCFPDESTLIKPNTPWAGSRSGKQVQQTWGVFEDVYCPSEFTFKFLENVLDEVMQLFPSRYIHIGGDECPKDSWKRSAFCQKLIKDKNLKDENGLQTYFISRIEKYLNSKGRNIIGWDEILEGGLTPNATVMSWRGEEGGVAAAKQHHHVIMTPGKYVYFDHAQLKNNDSLTIGGYLPLDTVYNYEPVPKELNNDESKYVLGAQANVWTEYIANNAKLEYMIFPRMSALSEVLWSPKDMRNLDDFKARLPVMLKRYEMWGVNYCKDSQ